MAICSNVHKELNEDGHGKCSVPMWMNGVPAGFCDKIAFGEPVKCKMWRDATGRLRRFDGKYDGYVPYLACRGHGGPKHNQTLINDHGRHQGDPCKYCGIPHDDVEPGKCEAWNKRV